MDKRKYTGSTKQDAWSDEAEDKIGIRILAKLFRIPIPLTLELNTATDNRHLRAETSQPTTAFISSS